MTPKGHKVSVRARHLIQVHKAQITAETKGHPSFHLEQSRLNLLTLGFSKELEDCILTTAGHHILSFSLSGRRWYSAYSQNTFPTCLFCIIHLKITNSLTKLSTFILHVLQHGSKLSLKATNWDWDLLGLWWAAPDMVLWSAAFIHFSALLAACSLLADRLQEGCSLLVPRAAYSHADGTQSHPHHITSHKST